MARINAGRFTHRHSGDLVVFLIGMRINRPWRPDLWLPAFIAMSRAESMYVSMPTEGLAQAAELVPVGPGSHHAKDRLSKPR